MKRRNFIVLSTGTAIVSGTIINKSTKSVLAVSDINLGIDDELEFSYTTSNDNNENDEPFEALFLSLDEITIETSNIDSGSELEIELDSEINGENTYNNILSDEKFTYDDFSNEPVQTINYDGEDIDLIEGQEVVEIFNIPEDEGVETSNIELIFKISLGDISDRISKNIDMKISRNTVLDDLTIRIYSESETPDYINEEDTQEPPVDEDGNLFYNIYSETECADIYDNELNSDPPSICDEIYN